MEHVFNIRVYGIPLYEGRALVTDEHRFGKSFTKFVGGGLEFGEGTIDCLKREFSEELSLNIDGTEHFYTTDFFQASAFHHRNQIISIYYLIRKFDPEKIPHTTTVNDFVPEERAQCFRWIALKDLSEKDMSFPIDKVVAKMLSDQASSLR